MKPNPFPLIAALLLCTMSMEAQDDSRYHLLLKSGTLTPEKNITAEKLNQFNRNANPVSGKTFAVIQFEEIPDEDWTRLFNINVMSGVRLARLCLPAMRRANWGRIIFISSESGIQIPAEMIHYGVTKAAQLAVSRGLAEAVAGTGITVNSILPGPTTSRGVGEFVETLAKTSGKSFGEFEQEFFEKVRPTSLIKRFATPEEVAALVVYVASPRASATTGAALRVDGGVIKSAF